MQVVSKVLSAGMTTMSIVHPEEGTFRPVLMLSVFRLHNVENDGDAVLIIPPNQALIGVCRVRAYDTVPPKAALRCLMVRDHDPRPWLQRQLPRIFVISLDRCVLMEHLIDAKCGKGLYLGLHASLRIEFLRDRYVFLVVVEEGS